MLVFFLFQNIKSAKGCFRTAAERNLCVISKFLISVFKCICTHIVNYEYNKFHVTVFIGAAVRKHENIIVFYNSETFKLGGRLKIIGCESTCQSVFLLSACAEIFILLRTQIVIYQLYVSLKFAIGEANVNILAIVIYIILFNGRQITHEAVS